MSVQYQLPTSGAAVEPSSVPAGEVPAPGWALNVVVGAGAVGAVGALLPPVAGADELGDLDWLPGTLRVVMLGFALAVLAFGVLAHRLDNWPACHALALNAAVATLVTGTGAWALLDDERRLTSGVIDAGPGIGLLLALTAAAVAVVAAVRSLWSTTAYARRG